MAQREAAEVQLPTVKKLIEGDAQAGTSSGG